MEIGMFHEFPSMPRRSETEMFDEGMAQIDAAERWGLDVMWLAEIHFAPERTHLASPLAIASAIGCDDSKGMSLASSPCAAKKPLPSATTIGRLASDVPT